MHLKRKWYRESGENEQLFNWSILILWMMKSPTDTAPYSLWRNCREYKHRLQKIYLSTLSSENTICVIEMDPILLYSFGATKWTVDELRQIGEIAWVKVFLSEETWPETCWTWSMFWHQKGKSLCDSAEFIIYSRTVEVSW